MLTWELEQILHILVYKILTDIYLVLHYGFFLIKQIGIFTKWEQFWQVGWFSMKLFWVKKIYVLANQRPGRNSYSEK